MIVQGRNEIEFDIIMGDGYKIPYDILDKFNESFLVTQPLIIKDTSKSFSLDDPESDYTPIFSHFCDKKYITKAFKEGEDPKYNLNDIDKFMLEFNELMELFQDVMNNRKAYEREFLIDNIIK